ncbi:hypothetical protein CL614_08305 [archaeon]|nr:hypothetical protein [archaeon]
MKFFSNITGLFVGQDSKKRQIGIIGALSTSGAFYMGFIDAKLYEWLMSAWIFWVGAAFSSRLTKLSDITKSLKKK